MHGWEFKVDSLDSIRWSWEHTEEKIEKNRDVDFFHDSRYFSVFLNMESVSVSVFSNIAILVLISIIRPTSKLTGLLPMHAAVLWNSIPKLYIFCEYH